MDNGKMELLAQMAEKLGVVPPLFSEAFTAFLNPEYWALQKIATLVK